ncbi:transposase [Methylicorpusculum oleiharenae]|uniref:REP-associated tyrosine transposase n=1 Tax=Methylicorpusculum oleiharenae TaxID=1338687 RepID=UPI001E2C8A5C|nr:transposase [Methylicorpusculum oleiharenae]MCD2449623.1 transposase [Methylicorpusculum oleiharenae]
MGRSRYKILNEAYPYFHTLTVAGWQPVFTRPESVQLLFDSFIWLQENTDFRLHAYVILENHLHFIASGSQHSKRIQQFKSFTARQILDLLEQRKATTFLSYFAYYKRKHKTESHYQFWQEGSHPEEMNNDTMLMQRLAYIHNNPVKRGYVDLPEHWRYSSARAYAGKDALLPIVLLY